MCDSSALYWIHCTGSTSANPPLRFNSSYTLFAKWDGAPSCWKMIWNPWSSLSICSNWGNRKFCSMSRYAVWLTFSARSPDLAPLDLFLGVVLKIKFTAKTFRIFSTSNKESDKQLQALLRHCSQSLDWNWISSRCVPCYYGGYIEI